MGRALDSAFRNIASVCLYSRGVSDYFHGFLHCRYSTSQYRFPVIPAAVYAGLHSAGSGKVPPPAGSKSLCEFMNSLQQKKKYGSKRGKAAAALHSRTTRRRTMKRREQANSPSNPLPLQANLTAASSKSKECFTS